MTPSVSIIIPCYNSELYIRDTLQSILVQSVPSIETIVVDDGSSDQSREIIKHDFPWVRLVESAHKGASRARNIGMKHACGKFIQFLDADDILFERKLTEQIQMLRKTDADIAYGPYQELTEQEDGTFSPARIVDRRLGAHAAVELFFNFWLPPAAYLFKRSIVEKAGAWNESLLICEDVRFVLDCALHGAQFVYCPGTMAYHRRHQQSLSRKDPVEFIRYCLKNAKQVEAEWLCRGGLSPEWKEAILAAYFFVARNSYKKDPVTFHEAYTMIRRLDPGCVPKSPRLLAFLSRIIGYKRAEEVAYQCRFLKGLFQRRK